MMMWMLPQASKNDGRWYFTSYESQAQKKIYFGR